MLVKLAGESGITLCTRWLYLIAASDAAQRKVKDVNAGPKGSSGQSSCIKQRCYCTLRTVHYVLHTTSTVHYATRAHAAPFHLDDPFLPGVNGDDLGVEKPPGATLILTMNRPIPNKAEPDCSWRVCEKYDS